MDILSCLADGLCKELRIHEMRTGAGCQIPAVLHQLHSPEVDLPVSFNCLLYRTSGLCKRRRIQDHHIVLFSLFFQPRKKIKHVLADKFHPVLKAVERRILSCLRHPQFGSVYSCHMFRACSTCIESKGSGVSKAVQHPRTFAELRHGTAVIFLIQEESGLLSVFYIHIIAHPVFHNLHLRVKGFSNESLVPLHAFLLPDFCIAPLIDTADMDSVRLHQFL